jgi:hypothetical protein
MSLLNLFKITLRTTCFDRRWSSSGVLKLFMEPAVLIFCASNVGSVVPSHIRVLRHAVAAYSDHECFLYSWPIKIRIK